LLRHHFAKHPNTVIQHGELKGVEVAPSAGAGSVFVAITAGQELALGLPSDALTKMTVHALCSLICIARKDGAFGCMRSKIVLLLGNDTAKAMLQNAFEHSPNVNKKCYVSRLAFLARWSAVCEMEKNILTIGGVNKHIDGSCVVSQHPQ
jgi:hypothetical protein